MQVTKEHWSCQHSHTVKYGKSWDYGLWIGLKGAILDCNLQTLQLQVSCALEKSEAPSLQLLPMYSPSSEIAAYSQGNRLASRKKVLPIIEILLKALETKGATAMHGCHGWKETSNIAQMVPTSCADICQDEDLQLPPTPMNSLVDGCPLDGGLPKLTPEDILEKINQMPGKRLAGTPCSDSH